jgi:predicted phage-related endonuclease
MPRLSTEQLEARKLGIGSSDVAAILNLSPFADHGPMSVFAEKTGILGIDTSTTDEKELGHCLESGLLDWFTWKTGKELVAFPGAMTFGAAGKLVTGGMIYGPEEWMFASIDGKIHGEAAHVECKNVGIGETSRDWNLSDDAGYPDHVRIQCAWQCECARTTRAYVMACVLGRPRVYLYDHDRELGIMLVNTAREFWKSVDANERPALDASQATREYLKAKYPTVKRAVLKISTPEIDEIAKKRYAAKKGEKQGALEKKLYDAQLIEFIADDEGVQGLEWTCTYKANKTGKRTIRFTWNGDEDE